MAKKKSFADDGWAIWVTGEDTSTFYLNEWIDPHGKSFVDIAVRIRGIQGTRDLNVYIPYQLEASDIEDLSDWLKNENIFRAIFSTRCVMDYKKNAFTSELAYHGKTMDLIHLSAVPYTTAPLAEGTLLNVPIENLLQYVDNNEAYFLFRLPHKSLDELFRPQRDVANSFIRLRDLVLSPVISEKYAYSVRVNEARRLPEEINKIGAFHRQKLNKAVVAVMLQEDYQLNDSNCYRIHRAEKELYGDYAPEGFDCTDAVIYEWIESRERNLYGHFNFYFSISRESISKWSMLVYLFLLMVVGVLGELMATLIGL